jgi:hypothetical protein
MRVQTFLLVKQGENSAASFGSTAHFMSLNVIFRRSNKQEILGGFQTFRG